MNNLKFSIVVPVFNRPEETRELVESLSMQRYKNFEVIIVEDGSTEKSETVVDDFKDRLDIKYFYKHNTGPGDSRNFGAAKSSGDYLVFFDSDCVVPEDYFAQVQSSLSNHRIDVYGGPDKAPSDTTYLQKAINYSMTSLLTTGGIRGHKSHAKKFVPRSFNMGVARSSFIESGGFSDIHPGEDPELVYRLTAQGATKGLIPEAFVYHKRRIDFNQFARQVYKFGLARTILMKWHPDSWKPVFMLPAIFSIVGIGILILGFINPLFWLLILIGMAIIVLDALVRTKNVIIAFLGLAATTIQVVCYGLGFVKGWWYLFVLNRSEQYSFPFMFKGV